MKTVVIDPGHGGKFPGYTRKATSTTPELREKDINLKFAGMLAAHIMSLPSRVGLHVALTRDEDMHFSADLNADLSARAKFANEMMADAFISIHCNAFDDPQVDGFEVWTSKGNTRADKLAEEIIDVVEREHHPLRIRKDKSDGDGDKEASFAVLTKTKAPAVLIELGFMTSPNDITLLTSDTWLDQMASSIARAVLSFLHDT